MSFGAIKHRLRQGRPLVVDSDTGAAFRARGVTVAGPGALGRLLRQDPKAVLSHYQAEVGSRVDVLCALTADTTPRALAEVGMEHRAAVLTGLAVELAFEAAEDSPKPVAVAGVLGSEMVSPIAPDRHHEELREHAERLAVAGCELLIARGQGSRLALMAAVVAAASTELPTWAVVECLPSGELITGGPVAELVEPLEQAGASVIMFEVASIAHGVDRLRDARAAVAGHAESGVLLAASDSSVRGYPDADAHPVAWAKGALALDAERARVIGGGAGTTEAHTAALAVELGALHPSLPVPGSRAR
ncbi:MAG: homocysteine S-methyltransferase family protein [Polyangiaceae bacterium]|nr:homocysteine S-methyltransferase family protein [Polyangiaceae bacterium]